MTPPERSWDRDHMPSPVQLLPDADAGRWDPSAHHVEKPEASDGFGDLQTLLSP